VTGAAPRRLRTGAVVGAVSALLLGVCCVGGVSAAFLTDGFGSFTSGSQTLAAAGCGEGGVLPAGGTLPTLSGLTGAQMNNAAVILRVGAQLRIPPRGWVVAVATALQESRLSNLPYLGANNDHDSIGLFQQRPSAGWGTPTQLMDPMYTARKFYERLVTVDGWQRLPLTEAAQRVQRSAYPDAYAKHEPLATEVVNALAHGAARSSGQLVDGALRCARMGQIAASGWTAPAKAVVGSGYRTADRPEHQGVDLIAPRYTLIRAAAAGVVTHIECDNSSAPGYSCDTDGSSQMPGCGWYLEITHADQVITRYCHMVRRPGVALGQTVRPGQPIGLVGTSGNSSGPHLHFEVHLNGDRSNNGAVDPVSYLRSRGIVLGEP